METFILLYFTEIYKIILLMNMIQPLKIHIVNKWWNMSFGYFRYCTTTRKCSNEKSIHEKWSRIYLCLCCYFRISIWWNYTIPGTNIKSKGWRLVPMVLAGNKCDLEEERQLTTVEGQACKITFISS